MAAIRDVVRRVPWTRQPQFPVGVDWSKPINSGLQATFSPVTGRMVDTNQNGFTPPTTDTGSQQVGVAGVSRAYTPGDASTFANNPRYGLASAMTLVIVCDVNTITNYGALLSCMSAGAGWELRLGSGATTSEIFTHRVNAAGYFD